MLGELWNFIKVSFKKRLVLYEIVGISFTLFGTFPNLLVKLLCLAVFSVAGGLFMKILTSQFISQLRLIIAHKNREKFPISNEIADLAKQMNVQVKELGIVKECTAYVLGKSIVLGIELLKRLTFNERQAVVAHELGHIKEKHILLRFVLMIPLLAIPLYSWRIIYSPIFLTESLTHIIITIMVIIAFLAYITLVMIPISWYLEARADRIAARFAGKKNIKSALLTIAKKEKLGMPSETHPSISERVKLIEKLKN